MENILDSRIIEQISLGDTDELSVQVSPIGEFIGSDINGNAIPEKLTEEALIKLAEKINSSGEEILCDTDHSSCRLGADKNTQAVGWFKKFVVYPLKGMWATIKLTALGKKLVENREYRFLSPVFSLNDKGEPIDIDSIAFTNKPAFKNHIKPILNSESNEILNKEIISMDMTKDELKELIISTISEMKEAEKTEEIKEEVVEEVIENKCSDEMKEVVTNEETTEKISEEKTEVVEETTEEKPVEEKVEEEKEEVIKIEALNSSPSIIKDVEPEWKKLKGKEFLDWAAKNKNYQI